MAALLHQIADIWLWPKNHSRSLIRFKTNEPLVSGMVWIMNLKPNLMLNTTILSPNPSSSVALPTGVVTPCPNWHLLCPLRFTLSPLAFLGSNVRKFDRINASFVRPSICASVLGHDVAISYTRWCGKDPINYINKSHFDHPNWYKIFSANCATRWLNISTQKEYMNALPLKSLQFWLWLSLWNCWKVRLLST